MATEIERLVAVIEARDAQFQKALDRVEKRTNSAAYRIENRFRKMGGTVTGILGSFGKGFVGGAVAGLVSQATIEGVRELVAETAKIGDVADRVGVTTDFVQELGHAAEQTGGSAASAAKGLETFAKRISEAANGNTDLSRLFEANGVALKDAQGKLRPVIELLYDFANLVRNAKTPADQLKFAAYGMGNAMGEDLVGALATGEDGLRKFGAEASKVSEQGVRSAQQIDDEFAKLKSTIVTSLKEGAIEGASWLTWLVNEYRNAQALADPKNLRPKAVRRVDGAFSIAAATPLGELRRNPPPTVDPPPPPPSGRTRQNDFEREIEQIAKRTEMLRAEAAAIGQGEAARSRALAVAELQNAATEAGIPLNEKTIAQIDRLADGYIRESEALRLAEERYQDLQGLQQEFGALAIDSIQGLIDGTMTLNDVLANTLKRFADLALQAAFLGDGPLAGLFGGRNPSGGVGGLIGALFGGFRATGGPVSGNRAYMVGERGPELMVPRGAGTIVPNSALRRSAGGGQPIVIQMQNDFRGVDASDRTYLESRLAQVERRAVAAAVAAVPGVAAKRPNYYGSGRS